MIKAVIFDIGGVIVTDILGHMAKDLAEKHSMDFELLNKEIHAEWPDYKLDIIKVDDFWRNFVERTGIDENVDDLKRIALEHINLIPGTVDVIKRLHEKYKLGIVSNCSHEWAAQDKKVFGFGVFDEVILSQEVKLVKPGKEIFDVALARLGLKAEECIFVDNKQNNVDAAKEYGFNIIKFENAEQLKSELKNLEVEI